MIDTTKAHPIKVPAIQSIMAYLYPKRTDCEVYAQDKIDVTELVKYLEKKNSEQDDVKITLFHCVVLAVARMIKERPVLNRFVQGWRYFEREVISLSFVIKRRFKDGAEESLMVFVPKDDDTIDSVSRKIVGNVDEVRKSEHATGGIDKVLENFAKIPRPILAFVIRIIRYLDFWGHTPHALTDGDPDYTTVLLSNLGSIKGPAIYHHLNNYGTNSILATIGTLYKEEVFMPDGTKQVRDMLDIGVTLDERIGDGFYFVKSLKLLHYIFANPELLDKPLSEPSGFDYG